MTDYLSGYKKRISSMGINHYERALRHKQREFASYFKNTLNKEPCCIEGKDAEAVFQDHSQSNNKDLSDDKYVILPNETKADVGNYIRWRDSQWLIFTEEFKTIPTHQQLKIKEVNEQIRWMINGKISNKGEGWGAYVQNQTLYTLGVSFTGNHLSVVNAKMMMYMQDNEETRSLNVQDRIFIGDNVYTIMFMDSVSRRGLINYLLEQDTISENDNRELRIADYYGETNKKDTPKQPATKTVIEGEDKVKIGNIYKFNSSTKHTVTEWMVESMDGTELPCYIENRNSTEITIKVKDDFRFVRNTFTILAKLTDGKVISKSVRVVSRF